MSDLYPLLIAYAPLLAAVAGVVLVLATANRLLLGRRSDLGAEARFPRQLLLLALTLTGLVVVVLTIPMSDNTRGQILSLLGIVLTGVIAISSTSFVANAMAGLMLRVVKSFRPGDFIHIGEQFGRVTERGLFHTEIQTEDRDLSTLPNLYLATNPLTVVHSSGTIISANLSLGYDVPWEQAEELLKQAAERTGLEEPFVLVNDLDDYSVSYRVCGFLGEVTQLLTTRSNLRKNILNVLHGSGVEIVSPAFMNQRRVPEGVKVMPGKVLPDGVKPQQPVEAAPEAIIFDKAEQASEAESQRDEHARLVKELAALKAQKKSADEIMTQRLESEMAVIENRMEQLELMSKRQQENNGKK